jgi:hypothetical protein
MARGQAVAYDYYAQSSAGAEYWQNEAIKVVEAERQRLEAELQARLDHVGVEVQYLESLNRRQVASLRWRVFLMFMLSVAIAGAAAWIFVNKIRPRVDLLQSTLAVQQADSDRLASQLREQTEKARTMEERYLAARAELDRGRRPTDAPAPGAAAQGPKATAVSMVAAQSPRGPQAVQRVVRAAAPVPAAPPPKKACICSAGDPMCGCL